MFFGMMKVEADAIYASEAMSQRFMMIMSCVTVVLSKYCQIKVCLP